MPVLDAGDILCLQDCSSVGLGAGGRIRQEVFDDPFGVSTWQAAPAVTAEVDLVDADAFAALTGVAVPRVDPDAAGYTAAGGAWYQLARPGGEGVDVIVVLDVADREPGSWTLRGLAADLGLPLVAVKRSLDRLAETTVFDATSRRVNRSEMECLLVDAVRFMFPARLGAQTRGVPTAWGTVPLAGALAVGDDVPVWPSPTGTVRGAAVEPLHEAAIGLFATRPRLYEQLTLVDGLRLGDARARGVAAELLRGQIHEPQPT